MKKIALMMLGLSTLSINLAYAGDMGKINASSEWARFYAGINLGYTTPNSNKFNVNAYNIQSDPGNAGSSAAAAASVAGAAGAFSLNNNGFIGGVQIGCARNLYRSLVAGLEADIQGIASGSQNSSLGQSDAVAGFAPQTISSNLVVSRSVGYLGTVRGRLGYLITPSFLFSGTGGFAYGGVNSKTSINQNNNPTIETLTNNWGAIGSYSNILTGWTIGSNFEWMIRSNWSAKIEYLYYDLGTVSYNDGVLADIELAGAANPGTAFYTNGVNTTTRFDGHIVRVGLNYHFL